MSWRLVSQSYLCWAIHTLLGGVRDDETYPSLLKVLLKGKYEVINAGVPGWGPFQEYELFNQLYEKYHPDYVVILLIADDFYRSPYSPANNYFLGKSFRDVLSHSAMMPFVESGLYNELGGVFGRINYGNLSENVGPLVREQMWYINTIDRKVHEDGNNLIILLYQHGPGYASNESLSQAFNSSFTGNAKVIILDEQRDFINISKDQLQTTDGHPSPLVYGAIARKVSAEIH